MSFQDLKATFPLQEIAFNPRSKGLLKLIFIHYNTILKFYRSCSFFSKLMKYIRKDIHTIRKERYQENIKNQGNLNISVLYQDSF